MSDNDLKDFASEVQTGPAARPRWLTILPYFLVLVGLGYFVATAGAGGLGGPNRVFLVLLAIWLIYTPVAIRRKWFAIRL